MQSKLPMHLSPALWGQDKERESVPVACNDERPLSDARRTIARSTKEK
jgi:hypothetical protein